MIRSLPEDVRCRLRSGIAITGVSQCVEELLLNSADARATCIAVRVDLEIFRVQVVDNGCGLSPEDMERVGMRYFTSKCHSLKDLEDLRCFGFRGEAMASMADVCSVVEISSKHKPSGKTFTKLFQNRKPVPVQHAETTRPSVGTTVTLYNLFYNLPVRRGCVDPVPELERIRQKVEAVSLMKPDISFSLKNDALHSMVLKLPKTRDVCSRFCQIYGPVKSQHLREIRHTQDRCEMVGFISSEGHYNKAMQFLHVNSRLVLKTRLHKLIDLLLKKESVICRPKAGQAGHTSGSPGFHRTSAELHGIFVLNIQCPYQEYDICFEPDKTLIEFQDWSSVLAFVEQGLKNFLKKENLYLEPSKEDVTEFNRKHHLSLPSRELSPDGISEPATSTSKSALENSDPASLRSKSVCRRKVISLHVMDDSAVVDKTDMKTASRENISLTSQTVTAERFDCSKLNSDLTPCRTGGLNLVADREEDMKRWSGQQNQLCNGDVTAGCSRLDSCNNDQELVTSRSSLAHHPGQCTPSNKSLNAELKAEDLNSSKPSSWYMHSSGGDPGHPSAVAYRPCSLDSVHSAVGEKQPNETIPYRADRLSVISERMRALGTDHPTGMTIYEMATIPPELTKRTKPLTLHLPLGVGSLDKFKRSYGKKETGALGPQLPYETELARAEASCPSMDRIQPALPETVLHTEGEKTMVRASPLTSSYASLRVKEPETAKPHSSLSTKLCRLKRDTDLASFPLEIRSGELQLKNDADHSTADPPQSTAPSSDIQTHENVNMDAVSLDCQPEREEPEPRPPETGTHVEEKEAKNVSPEWLQHYEQTLGRNVFINTCTGLSTYSAPQEDQTAACTKDLSTMSVRVVCGNGFQYQCHPFRSELLVPFLPRPSTERGLPSQRGDGSLQTLYSGWQNPVFPRHPEVAVDISKERSDSLAVKIHNILYPYRFTKDMILSMEVLQQVDNKFIACLVDTKTERMEESGGNLLVLVDQHAAHERVRLEQLIADSYEPSSEDGGRRLKVSRVSPPLELDVTEEQSRLLRIRAGALQRAGLTLSFRDNCPSRVLVSEIPQCFVEKKVSETQQRRVMVARKMVEEFLQEEVQVSLRDSGNLLVLVDQHAAHERVRLEQLIADSYEPSSEDGGRRLKVSRVSPPLELDVTEEQSRLLRIRAGALQRAGLTLSFRDNCPSRVLVSEIPQCFVEKKVSETQQRRVMVARKMVEEFLQEEVQGSSVVCMGKSTVVYGVRQCCVGAVKFNDPLSADECRHLVRCLAQCSLPFQCAHGRPAILPLADLRHLQPKDQVPPKPNLSRLRRHYKAWQLFGAGSSRGTEQPIRAETHPGPQLSQAESEP
ncbi:PREDICTED: DNA mismatch repair protein Mlh3 [Nanorana parkeri]|uniref:DNA mismatch repair protein Mlh3 n=1 Tax=Nanorana parkeri TaxID=125878 RepID=UPI000855047A|nr:PREDICTED: DNA mismatch repair protein Mlh3 [Nanorana parkeri]